MKIMKCYLNLSEKKNWYYGVKTFVKVQVKGRDGKSYQCTSPIGANDTRALEPDAITTTILPSDFQGLSKEQVTKVFPAVANMDTTTGEVTFDTK